MTGASMSRMGRLNRTVTAGCCLSVTVPRGPANTTAGYTAVRFPRRKLGPGYRAVEVDEFIARIEATLTGNARPGQAVTAADVRAVTFNVTRGGGYEELTVDEVLNHCEHELDKLTPFPPAAAPGN